MVGCRNEAAALVSRPECTADEAARDLGSHCMVGVAVTDGARGSCISALGQVSPSPASHPPVDAAPCGTVLEFSEADVNHRALLECAKFH